MYHKQLNRLKWQKIALVGLMTIFTMLTAFLPAFAATSGIGGENYPQIPYYLELHYTDGKSTFADITDRFYLSDRIQGSTTSLTGRPDLTIKPVGISIGSYSVLNRKGINAIDGNMISGFTITCPTFYLTKDADGDFEQTVPQITIPSYSYCVLQISYDIYMGGTTPIGHVERTVTSTVGNETKVQGVTNTEIINNVPALNDFTSCRIDNFKMATTSYAFSETTGGDTSVLGGMWVLNEDIYPYISGGESYVTCYFNYSSAGKNFIGMEFRDGLQLLYVDLVSGTEDSLEVWDNETGWVNTEYRTIVVDNSVTWDDVAVDEYNADFGVNGGSALKAWLGLNATKNAIGGTSSGYVFTYLYRTSTLNYIHDALNKYTTDHADTNGGSWQAGYNKGHEVGKDEGFELGYQEAMDETNPNVTSWLSTAVGGILGFEILPNISFLTIIGIILTISLTIALLKFFAGG